MRLIFFDSWAWISIANSDDAYHLKAVKFYQEYLKGRNVPTTSDFVMAEVLTILRRRMSLDALVAFGENFYSLAKNEGIRLESITQKRQEKAWNLFKHYRDKPNISFTDFTSFVMMKELKIKEVFTGDKHFEQVGMGFSIVP